MSEPEYTTFPFSSLEPGDELKLRGDGIWGTAIVVRVHPNQATVVLVNPQVDDVKNATVQLLALLGTFDPVDFDNDDNPFAHVFFAGEFRSPHGGALLVCPLDNPEPELLYYDYVTVTRAGQVIHTTPGDPPK